MPSNNPNLLNKTEIKNQIDRFMRAIPLGATAFDLAYAIQHHMDEIKSNVVISANLIDRIREAKAAPVKDKAAIAFLTQKHTDHLIDTYARGGVIALLADKLASRQRMELAKVVLDIIDPAEETT